MLKLTANDSERQTLEIQQSLHELAREGARRMIVEALELEGEEHVKELRHLRDEKRACDGSAEREVASRTDRQSLGREDIAHSVPARRTTARPSFHQQHPSTLYASIASP